MTLDPKDLADAYTIEMPVHDTVHMDVPYVDGVVNGQGAMFLHYRAIPCPVGLGDPYDVRKVHADHAGCSNGHLYEFAGEVACIFSGNSKQIQLLDVGVLTGSTVQITLPRYYNDKPEEEVHVAPFDRMYLKTDKAKVVTFQRLEHNTSGLDRLNFPATEVEFLIDADGIRYYLNQDFTLESGNIRWGRHQPGMDPATSKGTTIAVRYRYVPFWYVDRILHEIRVVQAPDPATGLMSTQRMPYAVLLQREYVFHNEQNDPRSVRENSPRQGVAPRSGSFGPR